MRPLALVAALVALLAAVPATAHANWPGCPTPAEVNRARFIPGYGDYIKQALEKCLHRRRMQRLFRQCLVAAGINAGITLVGGIIGQMAARGIAGGMVPRARGAASMSCGRVASMFWRAFVYFAVGIAVAIVVLRVAGIEGTASTVALAGVAFVLAVSLRWVTPAR